MFLQSRFQLTFSHFNVTAFHSDFLESSTFLYFKLLLNLTFVLDFWNLLEKETKKIQHSWILETYLKIIQQNSALRSSTTQHLRSQVCQGWISNLRNSQIVVEFRFPLVYPRLKFILDTLDFCRNKKTVLKQKDRIKLLFSWSQVILH